MRKILIALALALIVLLSGCLGGSTYNYIFVGGEDGLTVSFVGSNPPARVFQNRDFSVILQLENRGEYNIPEEAIRILFSNGQTFGVEDADIVQSNSNMLQKRIKAETDFIPGGVEYISFEELSYSGPTMLTEDSPISLSLDVCYPYKTTSVADVCVSTKIDSDICDPLGEPIVQTTGGPILVSKIKQLSSATSGDKVWVDLEIDFELVGDGKIYDIRDECSNLDNDSVLTIEQISIGGQTFSSKDEVSELCSGKDNRIGLHPEDKTQTIICNIPVENVIDDYTDRFTITVIYNHAFFINKQISVMPVLESIQKCIEIDDCPEGMYCEQPGFCRTVIPDDELCGLPVNEDPDLSCAGGFCKTKTNEDGEELGCVCASERATGERACTRYYTCDDVGDTIRGHAEGVEFEYTNHCYDTDEGQVDQCFGSDCYVMTYSCDGILHVQTAEPVGESLCVDGVLVESKIDYSTHLHGAEAIDYDDCCYMQYKYTADCPEDVTKYPQCAYAEPEKLVGRANYVAVGADIGGCRSDCVLYCELNEDITITDNCQREENSNSGGFSDSQNGAVVGTDMGDIYTDWIKVCELEGATVDWDNCEQVESFYKGFTIRDDYILVELDVKDDICGGAEDKCSPGDKCQVSWAKYCHMLKDANGLNSI